MSGLGRVLTPYAVVQSVVGQMDASNKYGIAMGGATTTDQVIAAEQERANTIPGLGLPIVGEWGQAINESIYGYGKDIANANTGRQMTDQSSAMMQAILLAERQSASTRLAIQGQATGDPSIVLRAMQSQADTDIRSHSAAANATEQSYTTSADAIRNSDRRSWWQFGFGSNPDMSVSDTDRVNEIEHQRSLIHLQDSDYGGQRSNQLEDQQNEYNIGQAYSHLGSRWDIEDRDRYTASSAYRGHMMPRTADAMDEITADRRAVEDYNSTHIGSAWAPDRALNTASVMRAQQQSFANLEFQSNIPGNAQEVSGMTSFGDFSNVGYRDYQKALAASAGGGSQIQGASDRSNVSQSLIGSNDSAAALLQAINQLINAINNQSGG